METFFQNLRYGLRVLGRAPAFTTVAVLILGLGIAANTLVFSIVYTVLLKPLPYPDADRLVMVWGTTPQVSRTPVSIPNFLDYRERASSFQGMAAFSSESAVVNDPVAPWRARLGVASAGIFRVLGVSPSLGRDFSRGEDRPGHARVVILSHGLWERRFGASPGAIDKTLTLNSRTYTVIGVMPAGFDLAIPGYFRSVDLWTPMTLSGAASRGDNYLRVIGRLKAGATLEQSRLDLKRVSAQLAGDFPDVDQGIGAAVVPLREQMVGTIRPALLALFGAVAFVLLIACANIAGLQLERASLRRREIGIRMALGADRARLIGQLLTENAILAAAGAVVGVLLALGGMKGLQQFSAIQVPLGLTQLIRLPVLLFTLATALGAALMTGLTPALQGFSSSLVRMLREGGRSSTTAARTGRLRDLLVVLEFSLSLVLLTGAGVLVESLVHLLQVPAGFHSDRVLVAPVQLSGEAYHNSAGQLAFFERALDRLSALPGVDAAAGIDDLPLTSDRDADLFQVEGQPVSQASELAVAQIRGVTPDYFRAMSISLLKGRAFGPNDRPGGPAVAIVNKTLVQRLFPGESPFGRRLLLGGDRQRALTIVGVVADVRDLGLERAPEPEIYRPFAQAPTPYISLVMRTWNDPRSLFATARREIHDLDRGIPAIKVTTMAEIVGAATAERRFNLLLISAFASVALLLAALGMYGVISFWASRRSREIGIRMALGANRSDIFKLVMGRGARLAAVSLALGVALSLALVRLISDLMYETSPSDPLVLTGVGLLLAAVAMLACWIPARRATSINPMSALRLE